MDRQRGFSIGKAGGYGLMVFVVLLIGAPLLWMLSGSLRTTQEIYAVPPVWIPSAPRWENFVDAWNAAPFDRFYLNTIITTIGGSGLELVNATLTAYAIAFLRFPKKNWFFLGLLLALMIPSQVTILPNYITMANVAGQNWINTYQGIILPGASVAFGTFLLRQAFLGLPREVLDAARVDGCGHVRLLTDIVVPMSQPVLVTFGLISLVAKWNDYLWPLIVTNTQNMRTLTVGISFLFDQEGNTQWGVVMAGTIFVVLPLLIVYVFAQKYVIEGMTAGATKG